jgi:hypothetical protein
LPCHCFGVKEGFDAGSRQNAPPSLTKEIEPFNNVDLATKGDVGRLAPFAAAIHAQPVIRGQTNRIRSGSAATFFRSDAIGSRSEMATFVNTWPTLGAVQPSLRHFRMRE